MQEATWIALHCQIA